jgi:WD40-like Beta Propeller Repeat
MSDPISDLKHELLAAAVRQQSHAATGREWTRAHSRRRWVIVAVAGLVLVGGLLATPALGIGERLLSLIQGKRSAQPGDVQAPAWSRDGRTIVFVSWRDGNREVYAMDADGSGPRNLTQHPARDVRPAWSPNGRRIAFVSLRDGNAEVYVMNADGSGKRKLTQDRAGDDD